MVQICRAGNGAVPPYPGDGAWQSPDGLVTERRGYGRFLREEVLRMNGHNLRSRLVPCHVMPAPLSAPNLSRSLVGRAP